MAAPGQGASQHSSTFVTSLAALVADVLRQRIISGELRDGDLLPRQEDLIAEFRVSRSSIREALRILETEGLVAVKRGKVGGAVVHAPTTHSAARPLGLTLQSQAVTLEDLAQALQVLEPACAQLCAMREDRGRTVVPKLRASIHSTIEVLSEEGRARRCSREFHELIVRECGNQTLITTIGALKAIWLAHELDWTDTLLGRFGLDERREGVAKHELILGAIEAGEGDHAHRLMWSHVRESRYGVSTLSDRDQTIHRYAGGPAERAKPDPM